MWLGRPCQFIKFLRGTMGVPRRQSMSTNRRKATPRKGCFAMSVVKLASNPI